MRIVKPAFIGGTLLFLSLMGSACGSGWATININSAESAVTEMETMEGEKYAPYEYYKAKLYMQKALEKNAYAKFQTAAEFADIAEKSAKTAYKKAAQKKHPETAAPANLVIEESPPPPTPQVKEEEQLPPGTGLPSGQMFLKIKKPKSMTSQPKSKSAPAEHKE